MSVLFIILVSLTMTLFIEKILIANRCICCLMPNLIKKSWTVSNERPPLTHSGRFSDEMIQFTMYMISLLMTNGQKRTIKRAKRTGHEFKICKEMGIKKECLPLFEIFLAETAQYSCYCSLAVSQCGTILTNFH